MVLLWLPFTIISLGVVPEGLFPRPPLPGRPAVLVSENRDLLETSVTVTISPISTFAVAFGTRGRNEVEGLLFSV